MSLLDTLSSSGQGAAAPNTRKSTESASFGDESGEFADAVDATTVSKTSKNADVLLKNEFAEVGAEAALKSPLTDVIAVRLGGSELKSQNLNLKEPVVADGTMIEMPRQVADKVVMTEPGLANPEGTTISKTAQMLSSVEKLSRTDGSIVALRPSGADASTESSSAPKMGTPVPEPTRTQVAASIGLADTSNESLKVGESSRHMDPSISADLSLPRRSDDTQKVSLLSSQGQLTNADSTGKLTSKFLQFDQSEKVARIPEAHMDVPPDGHTGGDRLGPDESTLQRWTGGTTRQVEPHAGATLKAVSMPFSGVDEGAFVQKPELLAPVSHPSTPAAMTASGTNAAQHLSPAQQIISKLSVVDEKSTNGTIEVRLDPDDLGKVRLNFILREAGMLVVVSAERSETLELLRRNAEDLRLGLSDMNFEGADLEFSDGATEPDWQGPVEDEPIQEFAKHSVDVSPTSVVLDVTDDRLDIRL